MSFVDILTLPEQPKRIAFTGYAHSGKDVAAQPLIEHGYTRRAYGDIVKRQCKQLVEENLGIDSHTEDPVQKDHIRPLLETWGELNYDNIAKEYFDGLPEYSVNTRICHMPEVVRWKEIGGVIVAIDRPGTVPQTQWEERRIKEQLAYECISLIIVNDSSIAKLHEVIATLFLLNDKANAWSQICGDRPWTVRCSSGLQSLRQLDYAPGTL